jgi:NAD(P)-dependent dehydrogenase (short-subunit alcohol dehydrogenase family)
MKKVIVTGHTSGIGSALFNYFSKNNTVIGVSKSTGFDITSAKDRLEIVSLSVDADIFINNAYNNFDDSQLNMLIEITESWKNTDKLIINVSSRYTHNDHLYCTSKLKLDNFCKEFEYKNPYILNIKPGLVDTPRVVDSTDIKMSVNNVVSVIEFALNNKTEFKIHSITFGK